MYYFNIFSFVTIYITDHMLTIHYGLANDLMNKSMIIIYLYIRKESLEIFSNTLSYRRYFFL